MDLTENFVKILQTCCNMGETLFKPFSTQSILEEGTEYNMNTGHRSLYEYLSEKILASSTTETVFRRY